MQNLFTWLVFVNFITLCKRFFQMFYDCYTTGPLMQGILFKVKTYLVLMMLHLNLYLKLIRKSTLSIFSEI